jgi:hypothetical protein
VPNPSHRRRLVVVGVLATVAGVASRPTAATPGHDHAAHAKPRHGGLVKDAGELTYELLVTPTRIDVWVEEHGKPTGTSGSTARLTLIDSGSRTEVTLAPAAPNRFEAQGSFPVKKGMTALLQVAVGGKEIAKLRYTLR